MNNSNLIFLIGANINIIFIRILRYFFKPNHIVVDQYCNNKEGISFIERFIWNKNDPILKYKIGNLAFDVLSKYDSNFKIKIFKTFFGKNKKYNSLYLDLQKKVYLEKVNRLLLLLAIANRFNNERILLIIPSSYREIFNNVKEYLENNKVEFISFKKNVDPLYLGFIFFDKIKSYLKIFIILILLLTKVKYIRRHLQIKNYKIGLLTWNSAFKIEKHKKQTFGLNSILPLNFKSKDFVIYSKNNLSRNYQESVTKNNFNLINFNNKEIFKYLCFSDLKMLLEIFFNINKFFLNYALDEEEYLIDELPKIIYNFIKWEKFTNLYYFDISISYNDYGISDLIRNKIFLEKNIQCWSYVHTMSDCYLYSKKEFILDPLRSLLSYSRRYYLMPAQHKYFEDSGIISSKSILIGPLFQNYKCLFKLEEKYKNKIIISVFSCSIGDNVLNPISSHICFFESLFKLIRDADESFLFIIKVKKADIQINKLNHFFNSTLFRKLHKQNKVLLVDDSTKSQQLINISNGVISMAFTSPTFEAISSKIPAIFYDPKSIAKGNYLETIKGIYITDESKVKIFLKNLIQNQDLDKWVSYVIRKIGLKDANLGVEKIKNDIELFFNEK